MVDVLQGWGHEVYDFKNPPGKTGFAWQQLDPEWKSWTHQDYIERLKDPVAQAGFSSDRKAMEWADTGILLLPCGSSSHIEIGWMAGQPGKKTYIFLPHRHAGFEPELMYLLTTEIVITYERLHEVLWEASS